MKEIRSKTDINVIQEVLEISLDENSDFALVEQGFTPVGDCINIVFSTFDKKMVKELIIKSGYFKTQKEHLIGKTGSEMSLIQIKDIIYIEGINNDTYAHTTNKEYSLKDKLYELESKLVDHMFVRISKSYIVSVNHINRIKPTFNGKLVLVLSNGTNLEVTRHYISTFRNVLGM